MRTVTRLLKNYFFIFYLSFSFWGALLIVFPISILKLQIIFYRKRRATHWYSSFTLSVSFRPYKTSDTTGGFLRQHLRRHSPASTTAAEYDGEYGSAALRSVLPVPTRWSEQHQYALRIGAPGRREGAWDSQPLPPPPRFRLLPAQVHRPRQPGTYLLVTDAFKVDILFEFFIYGIKIHFPFQVVAFATFFNHQSAMAALHSLNVSIRLRMASSVMNLRARNLSRVWINLCMKEN